LVAAGGQERGNGKGVEEWKGMKKERLRKGYQEDKEWIELGGNCCVGLLQLSETKRYYIPQCISGHEAVPVTNRKAVMSFFPDMVAIHYV